MKKLFYLLLVLIPVISFCDENEALFLKARGLYLVGRYEEAETLFCELSQKCPRDKKVKNFLRLIREDKSRICLESKDITRGNLIREVDDAWQRPVVFGEVLDEDEGKILGTSSIEEKLLSIIIPAVNLCDAPLPCVVQLLGKLAFDNDDASLPEVERGVNIVLIDPSAQNPKITLNLKNVTLNQLLNLVTQAVGYSYYLEDGIVTIRNSNNAYQSLVTQFFPITRGTIIKMTGHRDSFSLDDKNSSGPTQQEEELAMRLFFQRAGVPFDPDHFGPQGAQFAFDGAQLIVTQTPKNLEKVANILARYKDKNQVEIESKFIEVQEGVLEELGFRWNVSSHYKNKNSFNAEAHTKNDNLRSLAGTFNSLAGATGDGKIVHTNSAGTTTKTAIVNRASAFPNSINIAAGSSPLANIVSVMDNWRLSCMIDALEQHTGADLMSAPKVTVLSGKTARITVAQVLRFPESYGDIQSSVGMAGADAKNSSAGVTITAGTPQNFIEKNVGVEMAVTPIVEDDGKSISLKLDPKVTEFEGFVEYGGRSIAISGDTTVDVPSGFFQPIFSTREIQTEVTIANGSTVVMGGLTREEIKQVHDKVPVLGDIPLLGRLFRSEGKTNQKKNLLIFVTANIVSTSGGSPVEKFRNQPERPIYKDARRVVPSGTICR